MNAILQCLTADELDGLEARLREEVDRPVARWALPARVAALGEIADERIRREQDASRRMATIEAELAALEADSVLED
jgi:hypothetical protein